MTEEGWRLISIFISALMIFSTIAYLWVTPRPREQFFQFYVLGEKRKISDYYPEGKGDIAPNTPVRWYLGITNFMGSVQYVSVRVKLGNLHTVPPNETTGTPANVPVIYEFRRFLSNNETWEFPFFWEISDYREENGEIYIALRVNNESLGFAEIGAENGKSFRLIFELWTYDQDSKDFIFGWYSGEERRICWLQMWFNATIPG